MTLDIRMKCLAAATAVALLTLGGCAGPAVIPTTYETYNAQDGAFAIEYPANWQVTGGGTRTYPWVKITSGSAEVDVDTDATGSILADIAKSQVPMLEIGDHSDAPPIQRLHESDKEDFDKEWGATEQAAVAVTTKLGDSRKSEFTGSGLLGGTFHGYRITALSRDKRIRMVCRCSESQWQLLQPAFDKMIASLAMGAAAF